MVAIADGFGIPRDSAFALGLLVHVDDPGHDEHRRGHRDDRVPATPRGGSGHGRVEAEPAGDGAQAGVEGGEPAP